MIHTEAAAAAEMGYGAGVGIMGAVVVATIGAGLGCVLYIDGLRVERDLAHLTWCAVFSLQQWSPARLCRAG